MSAPAVVAVVAAAAVVAAVVAIEAAAAAAAGVVPLVFPAELATAVRLRCCWRCSVAFGGAFAAFSRPAAWIHLGAVAPPGAVDPLAAAIPLPGAPRCVAVGARLGAGSPLATCRCPVAVGAPAVRLLLPQLVLPAPASPVNGSIRFFLPSPACPRVLVPVAAVPVVPGEARLRWRRER